VIASDTTTPCSVVKAAACSASVASAAAASLLGSQACNRWSSPAWARAAAVADRRVTGLSREVLAELVVELGPRWQARQEARLADRLRRRAVGAGARYRLVFLDRLLATLVHLRHGVTHDVLACRFGGPARRSPGRSARCAHCWGERGCTVEGGSGCAPWPRWSPT
jgi:hypothetical protein